MRFLYMFLASAMISMVVELGTEAMGLYGPTINLFLSSMLWLSAFFGLLAGGAALQALLSRPSTPSIED